jgi:hypothetical protein
MTMGKDDDKLTIIRLVEKITFQLLEVSLDFL